LLLPVSCRVVFATAGWFFATKDGTVLSFAVLFCAGIIVSHGGQRHKEGFAFSASLRETGIAGRSTGTRHFRLSANSALKKTPEIRTSRYSDQQFWLFFVPPA